MVAEKTGVEIAANAMNTTESKTRAQRKAEARERAKTSILLDEQIQTIGRAKREAEAEKKRQFDLAHPVTSGLIPMADYVPATWRYHS